jgi:hypothetical protein
MPCVRTASPSSYTLQIKAQLQLPRSKASRAEAKFRVAAGMKEAEA